MKRVAWVLWALRSSYRRGESGDGPSIIVIVSKDKEKRREDDNCGWLISSSVGRR